MSLEKVKEGTDWLEGKTGNKSGFFTFGFLFAAIPLCAVIWIFYGNLQYNKETIKERDAVIALKDQQIMESLQRESRIKEDCAETVSLYFEMFKSMGTHYEGTVKSMKNMEIITSRAISKQDSILKKISNGYE